MPSGNGCRANQRREREMKKQNAAGVRHTADDLKKHEQSKNAVQCTICLQGFPRTARRLELETHLENRHAKAGKTFEMAFPAFVDQV